MKFQPGQVVHVVDGKRIRSAKVGDVWTELDGSSLYEIRDSTHLYQPDQLFATFDNAMAELNRQNEEGK